MVKLVDTPDLGSGAARHESSSLFIRTIPILGSFKQFYSHFKNTLKTLFYYILTTVIQILFFNISPIQPISAKSHLKL